MFFNRINEMKGGRAQPSGAWRHRKNVRNRFTLLTHLEWLLQSFEEQFVSSSDLEGCVRVSPATAVATRRVQNLVEERRKLVDEKTEQINRLTRHLKIYFPQMLDWFDRLDREAACALLERWPTLEELQKVPPAKLRTFFC